MKNDGQPLGELGNVFQMNAAASEVKQKKTLDAVVCGPE